ncbi:MAG TPA: glutamate--tRNA ligase [Clostridia bacterium]|nr:glutamate--tRNA ligase [Clostridia bacterium]
MDEIRVRFAPSPTGPLHIGGARSALFNFLLAKKAGGTFVLRIEDTDLERSSPEAEENIKESLKWLGITWDEGADAGGELGPYRQTERLSIYDHYAQQLLASGQAYRCYCTDEELEAQRQSLLAKGEMPRYLGNCRELTEEQEEAFRRQGTKPAIRFRVPAGELISVNDLVRGEVVFESDGIGDFVIVKSDGIPTYNFAVVIDDALMKISHVVRGEEHLSNTPRQILIYQALGFSQPAFAHISLILGKDRSKMSKRHGSTSVVQYREKGYLPAALVNFLALLGWSPEGEEEIFSLEELIERFSLDRVAKNPAVFDLDKLNWINGYYIRQASPELITEMAISYLQAAGYLPGEITRETYQQTVKMVAAVQEYLPCVSEIVNHVQLFFSPSITIETEEARAVIEEEQVPEVVRVFARKLDSTPDLESATVKKILKETGKELKLGGRKVFMPLRVALTGRMHGPELHDIISILGKEEVLRRLRQTTGVDV